MKRFTKLNITAAAAALVATGAIAETPQASTGTGSEVASDATVTYDTNSPRITNGDAASDANGIAISTDKVVALESATGEMLSTTEGSEIGVIEDVTYNAQGNPELVIAVVEDSAIEADTLVMTIQPGNILLADSKIVLDTTYDELMAKVTADGARESGDRVDVTLF